MYIGALQRLIFADPQWVRPETSSASRLDRDRGSRARICEGQVCCSSLSSKDYALRTVDMTSDACAGCCVDDP